MLIITVSHNYIGHIYLGHHYIDHHHLGHRYLDHHYRGHTCRGRAFRDHAYISHDCTSHNFFFGGGGSYRASVAKARDGRRVNGPAPANNNPQNPLVAASTAY